MGLGRTYRSRAFQGGWWPERLASLIAVACLLATVLGTFDVRSTQSSGSDFKTLYASAWCFTRGLDAYSLADIAKVFTANGVVPPLSWYAHTPVYPPLTLVFFAPLTMLSMVAATYLWVVLSGLMFALAIAALARTTGEMFGLGRGWRFLVIALAAASPLLSFGLEMGNVSVIAVALCVLAITAPVETNLWLCAIELALAVLLKPHLAVWVVIALVLFRAPRDRILALRACTICFAAVVPFALWTMTRDTQLLQFGSYRTMLASELAGGSMAVGNHELIGVPAQITSLGSLLGYWMPHASFLQLFEWGVLILMFTGLVWSSWRRPYVRCELRHELIAAWCAFGMIVTYHRAHDGMLLLVLLPSVVARIRRSWSDGLAWCTLALSAAMSLGPTQATLEWLSQEPRIHFAAELVLYRQASLAAFGLALLLLAVGVHAARRQASLGEAAAITKSQFQHAHALLRRI